MALLIVLAAFVGCSGCGGSGPAKSDAGADGTVDLSDVSDAAPVPDSGADQGNPSATEGGTTGDTDVQPTPDAVSMDAVPEPPATDARTDVAADSPVATDSKTADADANAAADADAKPLNDTGVLPADSSAATCNVCSAYGTPTQAGRITASNLANVSGIAASKRNPGVLYVHNDMTRTELFALDEAGTLLATFNFPATAVVDMEDVAVGPCPTGSCVFLADIGGNTSSRTTFGILRIAEPAVTLGQAAATMTVTAEKLTFSYPDGANHNAESLLVDPATGDLYVITKETSGPSTVYKLPTAFGAAASPAQKVVLLTVPTTADGPATSASAHPCGAGFLLRTNTIIYEFRAPLGSTLATAFAATPVSVPFLKETQGEAVTYRANGLGYFNTGEGAMQPINQVGCK